MSTLSRVHWLDICYIPKEQNVKSHFQASQADSNTNSLSLTVAPKEQAFRNQAFLQGPDGFVVIHPKLLPGWFEVATRIPC